MSAKQKKKGRFLVGVGVGAMLVILAIIYRCSGGHFGSKGGEKKVSVPSTQNSPATKPAQHVAPCKLRLDSQGLELNSKPIELEAAVKTCKKSGKGNLLITGGANSGEKRKTITSLRAAGIALSIDDRGEPMPAKDAGPAGKAGTAGKATPPKPAK